MCDGKRGERVRTDVLIVPLQDIADDADSRSGKVDFHIFSKRGCRVPDDSVGDLLVLDVAESVDYIPYFDDGTLVKRRPPRGRVDDRFEYKIPWIEPCSMSHVNQYALRTRRGYSTLSFFLIIKNITFPKARSPGTLNRMGATQTKSATQTGIIGGDDPRVIQTIKRAKRSTVKIIVGERVSSGSGVVIPNVFSPMPIAGGTGANEYMAVTCYHVINQPLGSNHIVYVQIPSEGEKRFVGKIRAVFPAEDLALLSFEVRSDDKIKEGDLPIPATYPSDESLVKSGEDVFALGYHVGGDLKVTKGSHAGWEKDAGGTGNSIQIPERRGRMHITALINRGSSGGGLFSMADGSLQGINDSAYHNHPDQMFFSNPVYVLRDMIAMLHNPVTGGAILTDKAVVLRTPLFGFCTKFIDGVTLGFLNKTQKGADDIIVDGLIVTKVLEVSAAKDAGMMVGDVITHVTIGGVKHALASSEGYVRVEWNNQPVTIFDLFRRTSYEVLKKGVTFTMYREDGENTTNYKNIELVMNASEAPYVGALRTVYHPFDMERGMTMVTFNGLVFQKLCMNHFDVSRNPQHADAMSAIQVYLQDRMQGSFIIITEAKGVEAQRFKVNSRGPSLLLKLNGINVSTLVDFADALASLKEQNKHAKLELWEKAGVKHVIFPEIKEPMCRIDGAGRTTDQS